MKCHILFSGKNKKKYHQFDNGELALRVVKVNKVFNCEQCCFKFFCERREA